MKEDKNKFICLFIVVFLVFVGIIPLLAKIITPDNVITMDFNYDSDCLVSSLGVEGLQVDIHAPSGETSYYTDVNGEIKIYVMEDGAYTYDTKWMNIGTGLVALDTSSTHTIVIELESYEVNPTFMWDTPSKEFFGDPIDLLYFDGSSWVAIATVDPSASGVLSVALIGLFVGTFMFEGQNTTFSIDLQDQEPIITEVYISPIGEVISTYYNLKNQERIIIRVVIFKSFFFLFYLVV